nr:hypothetical protein [Tanacetum cinerariifolium]
MAQNINFFGYDQIQNPQYPDVQENPPNEEFEACTNANDDKMNNLEIEFDQLHTQDFQKNGDDFQMRNFMQNFHNGLLIPPPGEEKEPEATTDTELSSTKYIHPLPVQEPPQNSDIRQLIREECCAEVPEQQKQKLKDTMLELVKICQEKVFLCIHDDVDDLIESALDSKLLLINPNSQHLDKKEEPEHLLSMVYEHLNITPETESDEVTESNVENLLPIPSKCEVTLEDEIECDMPANDVCSPVFTTFSNPLFKDNDDLDSSDDESLPDEDVPVEEFKIYSNPLFDEDEDGNSQQEVIDIVSVTDEMLPPSVENDDDLDIHFLEELLIDDSILSHELSDSNLEENPSIPRPPPEPPDAETDAGVEIQVVMNDKDENDEYSSFIFVIFDKVFSLLSAESEDTIFDPGISD